MRLIKILYIILLITLAIQGEEMQQIEIIWNDMESYWKIYDKKIVTGNGDTQKNIIEFEKKYNVVLPQKLIYSLKRNYQNSRKGREALKYPWFGSNVGIDLLSISEIEEQYIFYKKYSGLEDTELENVSTIFLGNLSFSNIVKWHEAWIPIVCNTDLPVVLFIVLDRNSKYYQKVIGFYDTYLEEVGDHFRFTYIADNYIEFLVDLKNSFFEYQKQNHNEMEASGAGKGFEFFYYEKKFDLPKGFWTDEYREKMLRKMGFKR